MDIDAFIQSGILVNYCLGFCTPDEIHQIESLSEKYPSVKNEIAKLQGYFEEQLISNSLQPSPLVKRSVMLAVYKQEAIVDQQYAPYIDNEVSIEILNDWVLINKIKAPAFDSDDICVIEMPSTDHVINFIVAARKGHAEEVHADFMEHLFIIQGSCMMNFDGYDCTYFSGDIISIKPQVKHSAVVTSEIPMLALVQRQYFM